MQWLSHLLAFPMFFFYFGGQPQLENYKHQAQFPLIQQVSIALILRAVLMLLQEPEPQLELMNN